MLAASRISVTYGVVKCITVYIGVRQAKLALDSNTIKRTRKTMTKGYRNTLSTTYWFVLLGWNSSLFTIAFGMLWFSCTRGCRLAAIVGRMRARAHRHPSCWVQFLLPTDSVCIASLPFIIRQVAANLLWSRYKPDRFDIYSAGKSSGVGGCLVLWLWWARGRHRLSLVPRCERLLWWPASLMSSG